MTVFYTATELSLLFLIHEEDTKTYSARELYINYAIELIIISLSTYLILKYKYYKHHILSIAIIVILCIITDILLKNFIHTNFSVVISSIVGVLGDCIIYTYFKFLIDHKYYYYLDILYIYGIFGLYLLSFIIIIIIHSVNESYAIFKEFSDFYSEKGVFHIILRFIIFGLLLQGFCADILEFLILDKLTPNYIIIGFEIGMIPSNLIGNEGSDRLLVSIISVLQLLSLLFYLEILELNFCSLNENTKKNINKREISQKDIIAENDGDNTSGIDGYSIAENYKGNELEIDSADVKSEELINI